MLKLMTSQEISEAITAEFTVPEAEGLEEAEQPLLMDKYEERLIYGIAGNY